MTGAKLVATLGGAGLLTPAPGTWGSLVVLPLAWAGPWWCLAVALLLLLAGLWAVPRAVGDVQDPGWVVVDEGVGQLLALAAIPAPDWPWVLAAFGLFRLFDITKPGPVGWADRRHGAVGVMLDDVIAGALAALVLLAAAAVLA